MEAGIAGLVKVEAPKKAVPTREERRFMSQHDGLEIVTDSYYHQTRDRRLDLADFRKVGVEGSNPSGIHGTQPFGWVFSYTHA